MSESINAPAIRFGGFTNPWEQRKLPELVDRIAVASSDPLLPQVEYEDINPGEGTLNKDLDEKDGGKTGILFESGDILYGKLRPYLMNWLHPQFKGIAIGDFWVLRASGAEGTFLYRLIQSDSFQRIANVSSGSKMPRADWGLISSSAFSVPSDDAEQRLIGAFFDRLDSLITLHQRKCDRLRHLKTAMLDKMFPKPDKLYPEIRFEGFTDPWEKRKLGELFEEHSEKDRDDLPALTIIQGGGTVRRDESNRNLQFDRSSLPNYKVVNAGDFIVHLRSFEGGLEKATSCGLVSPAYHIFQGKNVDSDFYYLYFRSKRFIDVDLKPHVYGIRDGRSIDIEGMKTIFIPWTNLAEQHQIGAFFDRLDSLITLHQRKYDRLRHLKSAMLDRMFI